MRPDPFTIKISAITPPSGCHFSYCSRSCCPGPRESRNLGGKALIGYAGDFHFLGASTSLLSPEFLVCGPARAAHSRANADSR